jgi:Peptidase family M20/M25/M40/Peptidase dimerisation domain
VASNVLRDFFNLSEQDQQEVLHAIDQYVQDRISRFVADLGELIPACVARTGDRVGVNKAQEWFWKRAGVLGLQRRRWFTRMGCVTSFDYSPVRKLLSWQGPSALVMIGHIDTVYNHDQAMTQTLRKEEGHLYGPGTHDMLGCNLVFFYVVEAMQQILPQYGIEAMPCRLILACAEEIGHGRSDVPILKALARNPDGNCIVDIEGQDPHPQNPSNPLGTMASSRKAGAGYAVTVASTTAAEKPEGKAFQLTFHGRPAHSGLEPKKGRNAVVAALDVVKSLAKYGEGKIQVYYISGSGGTRNTVPYICTVLLDNTLTIQELKAVVKRLLIDCVVPDITCEVIEAGEREGRLRLVSHNSVMAMAGYVLALIQLVPPEGCTNSPGEIKLDGATIILDHDRRVSTVEAWRQSDQQVQELIERLAGNPSVTLDVEWDALGKPPLPSNASQELVLRIQRLARLISCDIEAMQRGGSADSAVLYDAALQPQPALQWIASAVSWVAHLPLPHTWSEKIANLAALLSLAAARTVSAAGGLGPVGAGDHNIDQEYILLESIAPTAALLAGLVLSNELTEEDEPGVLFLRWLAYLSEAAWLWILSKFFWVVEVGRRLCDCLIQKKSSL